MTDAEKLYNELWEKKQVNPEAYVTVSDFKILQGEVSDKKLKALVNYKKSEFGVKVVE